MKKATALACTLLLASCSRFRSPSTLPSDSPELRARLGEMGQHSYETGCLHATQDLCGALQPEKRANLCRENGRGQCEEAAKNFRKWLDSGQKTADRERSR